MMKLQFSSLNVLTVNVTLNNKVHDYNFSMFANISKYVYYVKTQQKIIKT